MSRALEGTGLTLKCHIKLETGMGRTGFAVESEREMAGVRELLTLPGLEPTGVFTHFAVSDEPEESFTLEQFARFTKAVDELERNRPQPRHKALRQQRSCGKLQGDLPRHGPAGLLLYGLYPGAERGGLDLKPVMRLLTRVAEITEHHAGDTISYGRIFTCERDMRLAVIPVGYADGLHRSLSGKFDVLINGKRAHQVGRICMDMCMVDVTDMPEVKTGDIVTVFGDEPEATELADIAGTNFL